MSTLVTTKAYESVLLNKNVVPIEYDLAFDVDLENFIVQASAAIKINIGGPGVSSIVLHALELGIDSDSVTWTSEDGTNRGVTGSVSFNSENQTVEFPFRNSAKLIGVGYLRLKWNFLLTDNLCGFYRSKYTGIDGSTRYMATTQFEATDARRAFPCVDEPASKAVFNVTLITPPDRVGISNMPVKETCTRSDGRVVYKYDPTPKMSTYILAFVVGEFDKLSVLTGNGVRTTVYTPKGKTALGNHALYVASKALPFFEEKFGIKYPLPKSDLLAIPDFAAGAMENWGCVTYRETRLLIDPENTPLSTKIACSRTVSHELAHMWFGNLVTMKWWTDLWLNEGFARLMEFMAVDNIFPEWSVWLLFVQSVQTRALQIDALESSHPVQVDVSHPDEINEIFDAISYAKGASVLRMLFECIGEDVFMEGVRNYLSKYAYSNAETENLWEEIGAIAAAKKPGLDVVQMMSRWTQKQGYPVVSISEKAGTDTGRCFQLTQQRFGMIGAKHVEEDATVWNIPISIRTSESTSSMVMMDKKTKDITVSANSGYVKFNAGQTSFFRCCYSEKSSAFEQLCTGVRDGALPPVDRLGFLSDMFACSKFGFCAISLCLDLASCFENEDTLAVIQELSSNLAEVLSVYKNDATIVQALRAFVVPLFKRLGRKLGWASLEGESSTDKLLRATVQSMLVRAKDEESMQSAKNLFAKRDTCHIEPDLRNLVYRTAMRDGSKDVYNKLVEVYKSSDSPAEKRLALGAISSADIPDLQEKTLKWALLSGEVRNQDVPLIVHYVSCSKTGGMLCWNFFKTHFQQIDSAFSGGQGFLLSRIVNYCVQNLNTRESASDVRSFFEQNPMPSAARAIKESLEIIEISIMRRERELDCLKEYFHV